MCKRFLVFATMQDVICDHAPFFFYWSVHSNSYLFACFLCGVILPTLYCIVLGDWRLAGEQTSALYFPQSY